MEEVEAKVFALACRKKGENRRCYKYVEAYADYQAMYYIEGLSNGQLKVIRVMEIKRNMVPADKPLFGCTQFFPQ